MSFEILLILRLNREAKDNTQTIMYNPVKYDIKLRT